jgi:prepilin-type processing-associated H-X9-DG protein
MWSGSFDPTNACTIRHSGAANYLFFDNHVQRLKQEKALNSYTNPAAGGI